MPIKIRSKVNGFRRCGVAHLAEWVTHPHDAFTPEQLERLKAEPMLQVVEINPEKIAVARDILEEGGRQTEALLKQSEQLSERLSQVELQRDALQDEVNVLSTDKRQLEAEIERLEAKLEATGKPGRKTKPE